MKFIDPKKGWKTYAVVTVGVGLGIAQYFGVHIPAPVNWALSFLGLGTLRLAVASQSAKSASDIAYLARLIIENVTTPEPVNDVTGVTIIDRPIHTEYLPPLK